MHNTITFNDTKLQSLNRRIGEDNMFVPMEIYEQSIDKWDGIPIIYNESGEHPEDFDAVDENPQKAASDVGGELVGVVRNPRIVVEGGPRFMASLEINNKEDEIYRLWQSGKLFPSTAFSTKSDGDRMLSPPIPNHVLLFPEQKDKVQPGDMGAYVNSVIIRKEVHKMENTKKPSFYDSVIELFKKTFTEDGKLKSEEVSTEPIDETSEVNTQKSMPDADDAHIAELNRVVAELAEKIKKLEAELATERLKPARQESKNTTSTESTSEEVNKPEDVSNSEVDKEYDELKRENESLKQKIAELTKLIEESETKAKHSKFENFLNTCVPVGMKATPEQISELQKQYDSDPVSLMISINTKQSEVGSGETSSVGNKFPSSSQNGEHCHTVGNMCNPFGTKKEGK